MKDCGMHMYTLMPYSYVHYLKMTEKCWLHVLLQIACTEICSRIKSKSIKQTEWSFK